MTGLESVIIEGILLVKQCAEIISVLLIAAGIVIATFTILRIFHMPGLERYNRARFVLSRYLVMALEFQLAADILATALSPGWEELSRVAAIAAIRTFLNYFLQKEMKEEKDEEQIKPLSDKPEMSPQ